MLRRWRGGRLAEAFGVGETALALTGVGAVATTTGAFTVGTSVVASAVTGTSTGIDGMRKDARGSSRSVANAAASST